jgi:PleD family two-component response regulator
VVVDQEGRIVLVNSQAERLFGYSRADLLARERFTEPKTEQRLAKALADWSAPGTADSDPLNVASVSRNTSRRGVLVIDDDEHIRYSLVDALEDEGYRAVSASNGVEALEVLRVLPNPPSVILLDLMMPVMDGWEFRPRPT